MALVDSSSFDIRRFIGSGCYSIVYEAMKKSDVDCGKSYAIKRFFLDNNSAFQCVLRERHILERLARLDHQCAFLPIMYYSFFDKGVFAFVLREGSGCDMYDLICHAGKLAEPDARFYMTELICALEHVHSLGIVHLDIKPENILFAFDGHTFLSDFDRSYDLTISKGKPTLDDFTGTPLFMAPEVAKGDCITVKADVWSMAVLAAELTSGSIRPNVKHTEDEFRLARVGRYTIKGLKSLSKPLQSFFAACLQPQPANRPNIEAVKQLRFLKFVDWNKVHNGKLKPPFDPAELLHRPAKEDRCNLSPKDPRLLANAFGLKRPVLFDGRQAGKAATCQAAEEATASAESSEKPLHTICGVSQEALDSACVQFDFVHPMFVLPVVDNAELFMATMNNLTGVFSQDEDQSVARNKFEESPAGRRRHRTISVGD